MDMLEDIFLNSGIYKRILNHRISEGEWQSTFPCARSIGFHIVTSGEVLLEYEGGKDPLLLKRGDIAFMARGVDHQLRSPLKAADVPLQKTCVTSGAYALTSPPIHPLFKELPSWVVVPYDSVERYNPIQQYVQLLEFENVEGGLGSQSVIASLLDVLFYLVLRRIIEEKALTPQSWCFAAKDPQIGRVLEAMHEAPANSWKLEELADHAGLSRAAFAQKFKKSLGETPLHYLTTLRIQKSLPLLQNTSEKLEWISNQVGYADAFTFSKSFKKIMGKSPKDFRLLSKGAL